MAGLEKGIERVGKLGVWLAPLLCLAGVYLLAAGTDETWILFGVRGLAEHGRLGADAPFRSVHSTGGLYTAVAVLLHLIGGGRLEILRLVGVVGLAAVLFVVHRWARRLGVAKADAWIVAAAPLALPGTFVLGSQAYGTLPAFLLVLLGLARWGDASGGRWQRCLLVGALLGTAGATRLECAFAAGAPFVVCLLGREGRRACLDALLVAAIAVGVLAVESGGLLALSVGVSASGEAAATGAGFAKGPLAYIIPLRLNAWAIGEGFLPFFVSVLASVAWSAARKRVEAPRGVDALLAFGWLAWLAWLVRSPVPHLRYAWPALASFMFVGALSLVTLARVDPLRAPRLGLLGLAFLVAGTLDGARLFLNGEADVLSWELSGEARQSTQYGPLHARHDQRAMAARLAALPPDAGIGTIGFNSALAFLTRRPVVPIKAFYPAKAAEMDVLGVTWRPSDPSARPQYVVLTPYVNRYPTGYMGAPLADWLEANTELVAKEGPYVLYRVTGAMPPTADVFDLDQWEPRLPHIEPKAH
jgi:hypothetical protein